MPAFRRIADGVFEVLPRMSMSDGFIRQQSGGWLVEVGGRPGSECKLLDDAIELAAQLCRGFQTGPTP